MKERFFPVSTSIEKSTFTFSAGKILGSYSKSARHMLTIEAIHEAGRIAQAFSGEGLYEKILASRVSSHPTVSFPVALHFEDLVMRDYFKKILGSKFPLPFGLYFKDQKEVESIKKGIPEYS